MRHFARVLGLASLVVLSLTLISRNAHSGGGLVELVLPDQIQVSATHPLPVTGSFSVTAPTGTQPVMQVGLPYATSDVTVTTASTALLGADSTRTYLLIQNKGSVVVYLGFGGAAVNGVGVALGPGGNYEALKASTQTVNAIAASATALLTIVSGS
jgi:hypothetical protein